MTFPKQIGQLRVIEYTDPGDYTAAADSWLCSTGGKTAVYLVIGQYDGDHLYTMLWCGEAGNVLCGWSFPSAEDCKRSHPAASGAVWHRSEP